MQQQQRQNEFGRFNNDWSDSEKHREKKNDKTFSSDCSSLMICCNVFGGGGDGGNSGDGSINDVLLLLFFPLQTNHVLNRSAAVRQIV